MRFTFVTSLMGGDPAVMEYIMGTESFSGTHFLREKLMGQLNYFKFSIWKKYKMLPFLYLHFYNRVLPLD